MKNKQNVKEESSIDCDFFKRQSKTKRSKNNTKNFEIWFKNQEERANKKENKKRARIERELDELRLKDNIFAKYQQNCNKSDLKANFKALLPKECDHKAILPFGLEAKLVSVEEPREGNEFRIITEICPKCGKETQIIVRKLKQ